MRRKKALLELSLWFYIVFSLVCLILYLLPAIEKIQIIRVWLLGTNILCLGLAVSMCVLLIRIIKIQKMKNNLRKGGHRL